MDSSPAIDTASSKQLDAEFPPHDVSLDFLAVCSSADKPVNTAQKCTSFGRPSSPTSVANGERRHSRRLCQLAFRIFAPIGFDVGTS